MKRIIQILTLLATLLVPMIRQGQAIDLSVTGSWVLIIDILDLQGGAGSDLISDYSSDASAITIDVGKNKSTWTISVRGSFSNWDSNMIYRVRRTSEGSGPGWVSGGDSWTSVNETDQQFFTGNRQRSNINVQCGITGVSLQIQPSNYSGTITYTVTES